MTALEYVSQQTARVPEQFVSEQTARVPKQFVSQQTARVPEEFVSEPTARVPEEFVSIQEFVAQYDFNTERLERVVLDLEEASRLGQVQYQGCPNFSGTGGTVCNVSY